MVRHTTSTDRTRQNNEPINGFTIVELLVAMAIASILTAAAYTLFANYTRTNTTQQVIVEIQQSLRSALAFMEQEIRMAGFNPQEREAGIGIQQATTTVFTFTADLDDDGDVTSANESLTYQLTGNAIQRTDNNSGTTATLIDNVAAFTFGYMDEGTVGTPPANLISGTNVPNDELTDIRSVTITATVAKDAGRHQEGGSVAPVRRTLNTQIFCRNLSL